MIWSGRLWLLSRSNQGVLTRASSNLSSTFKTYKENGSSAASKLIDEETIKHLERLSLVDFANERGIARLQEAIVFADQLKAVDTTGIEPLVSVLEDEVLHLREDKVTEETKASVLLSTASVTEEDYYVAPPGNIPLASSNQRESH
ncbi:Glutamyl-tRNA(Gln) amidotransferase subunit C, mitochondrial [Frankliniella fusca]|uniref:Glutamyl-tRNA(Gln) amidotransferase subunit C, mitochondrial n=1 Tax=Frankliniella fusca TaxID=407009 RepID=A0AAE1I1E0_9NEOP|nr:Glutamyl-tRNA(Gln) amidotransferase subunit C, mitochondrial [Frankliniella fusca]